MLPPVVSVLLACVAVIACSQAAVASDAVVTLTDNDFDDTVTHDDVWMVKFYAPWCGHCKHLAPVFESAAKQAAQRRASVRFGKVDATAQSALHARFDISGYPTLVFRAPHGEWTEYNGGRTEEDLEAFVARMARPAVTQLFDDDEHDGAAAAAAVTAFIDASGDLLAFVFCPSGEGDADDTLRTAFQAVADERHHEFTFVAAASAAQCASFTGASTAASVVKLQPGEQVVVYPAADVPRGELRADLSQWVTANQFPLVAALSPIVFQKMVKSKRLIVVGAIYTDAHGKPKGDASRGVLAAVHDVARTPRSQPLAGFLFASVDITRWSKWVAKFKPDHELPGMFVLDMEKDLYFSDTGAIVKDVQVLSKAQLLEFMHAVVDGTVAGKPQDGVLWPTIRSGLPYAMFALVCGFAVWWLSSTQTGDADDQESKQD